MLPAWRSFSLIDKTRQLKDKDKQYLKSLYDMSQMDAIDNFKY